MEKSLNWAGRQTNRYPPFIEGNRKIGTKLMDQDRKTLHRLRVIKTVEAKSFPEKRQLPRFRLSNELIRLSRDGRIYSLCDLSQSGISFWLRDPAEVQHFSVGLFLEGTLNLKREKFPVKLRVRHLSRERVGGQFENLPAETQSGLEKFLDPRSLGAELKRAELEENENEKEGEGEGIQEGTQWFHGPSGTDLVVKRTPDGDLLFLSLSFLGVWIQWDPGGGWMTGEVSDSGAFSEKGGILRLESFDLILDEVRDSKKLTIAKTLLLSSNLPSDLKTWIMSQFPRG